MPDTPTDPDRDGPRDLSTGEDGNDDPRPAAPATVGGPDHGRVRLLTYADLESLYDHPDRVGRFAGLVDRLRDPDGRTLVVGAGDDTALGVLALLTDEGRAAARPFFEAVAPDADTFGNHDFDGGEAWAREWADSVPAAYLCANLADAPVADVVPDWTTVDCAGTTVGLVGVAHPRTAEATGVALDVSFADPVPAVRRSAAECRAAGADRVVVLSHAGRHDREVAAGADVDVVVGGHVHDRRVARVDDTLLVRTDGGGTELAAVRLGPEPSAPTPASVTVHAVPAAPPDDGDPFDADLAAAYRRRRETAGVDEVLARVGTPLPRRPDGRTPGESRVGNFAADAFRAAAGADLALVPAGALRGGPAISGTVTVGDVVGLCPFDGDVVGLDLDGTALEGVLAAVADPAGPGEGWLRCHLSGGRVRWNRGGDLRSVGVGGAPLDPDGTYRVATSEFLAVVDAFPALSTDGVVGRHGTQYGALVAHARAGGLDVALEGRVALVDSEDERDAGR